MITLDKQFGEFYDIFMKAKDISEQLECDSVKFEFNGVYFVANTFTHLPRPYEVEAYVRNNQGGEVHL